MTIIRSLRCVCEEFIISLSRADRGVLVAFSPRAVVSPRADGDVPKGGR